MCVGSKRTDNRGRNCRWRLGVRSATSSSALNQYQCNALFGPGTAKAVSFAFSRLDPLWAATRSFVVTGNVTPAPAFLPTSQGTESEWLIPPLCTPFLLFWFALGTVTLPVCGDPYPRPGHGVRVAHPPRAGRRLRPQGAQREGGRGAGAEGGGGEPGTLTKALRPSLCTTC